MILIQRRSVGLCCTAILIVIGVFAKNTSAKIQYDIENDDGNPRYECFITAAQLSKSLASRNHTLIATESDILITEDKLKKEIDEFFNERDQFVQSGRDECKQSWKERIKSTGEYIASNEMTINRVFNQTPGKDEGADELNAQIIRHQLTAPMRMIQSLLSLTLPTTLYMPPIDSEELLNAQREHKSQSLKLLIIEQFKYKPRIIKEVLDDFNLHLRDPSKLATIERPLDSLNSIVSGILASDQIPTVNQLNSLSTEWKNLATVIGAEQPHSDDQNSMAAFWYRMQKLTKCSELGMTAYKDCRNDPTTLAAFSARIDEFQTELQKWREYEQTIYAIAVPVLKEMEKSPNAGDGTSVDSLILPLPVQLNKVLVEMQQQPLYSNGLGRVIEDTRQLIRMVDSLKNHLQVCTDKYALTAALYQIQQIRHELPENINALNGIITANLMLERCMTTREVLKMRIIPFDQDYLELCNMPAAPNPSMASEHVKQNLLENIEALKSKIRYTKAVIRKEDEVTFISRWMTLKPLYVWKSKDFKNEINKLLNGETVILNADIGTAPEDLRGDYAVRFTKIELDFHFANESRQHEFNLSTSRQHFGITMKMVGDNYYRCSNRSYYIPTDVNMKASIFHIDRNGVVDLAVMDRDAFLSPYTIWQLSLYNWRRANLAEFIGDEIDLHLIGEWRMATRLG